jgi:hypothetical protein
MGYETVSYLGGQRAQYVLWPEHNAISADDAIDGVGVGANFLQGSSTQTWITADLAQYIPVRIRRHVVAKKFWFSQGATGTNNIDIGIFDRGGTKVISTGLTAKAAATDCKIVDVTDTPLKPDLYYLGMTCVSATATFIMFGISNLPVLAGQGVRQQQLGAGAALPSSAAGGWVEANTLDRVIRMGIMVEPTNT